MLDPRTPYIMRHKGEDQIMSVAIGMCFKDRCLCYNDFDRGHMLKGRIVKHLKNGIVFKHHIGTLVFTPMTLEEFDLEFRPYLPEEVSQSLQDLDDVYVWYRKQVNMS